MLWRISRHRDLSGIGGLKASGRWHFAGRPVVYLAENPAAALLEVCVHTAGDDIPPEFTLLQIEGPDVRVSGLPPDLLPENWILEMDATREIGTAWLQRGQDVLLELPSALVPHTKNYLFNPLHADAKKFFIAEAISYPFDVRLKRKR